MRASCNSFLSRLLALLCLFMLFSGCSEQKTDKIPTKELLVYCGITMIQPMAEIAKTIEKQENCKIIITKDGSGNLLKSIRANQIGDLYLPGSESYIKTCLKEGLVSETAFVGYNKAAMMVQKGNPKGITAELNNLTHSGYYVVVGNPNSGSIGRETQTILDKKGIFDEVINNARRLTTDSKELAGVLIRHEADLVINWYATSTWADNAEHIDVLPIDGTFAQKKKLILGLLKTSKHPEIAKRFMEYAASPKGQELFRKYGLFDVQ